MHATACLLHAALLHTSWELKHIWSACSSQKNCKDLQTVQKAEVLHRSQKEGSAESGTVSCVSFFGFWQAFARQLSRNVTCAQSKSFGGTQSPAANSSSTQTNEATFMDYLQFGRAIGDQPKDVEKSLRTRNVPVKRDSSAEDYIER